MKILLFLLLGIFASAKPNIVFIIADDCTFRDLGCYGGQAHTPYIDKMASQGMRFTRCFQTAPMCSPTRHNIYTGLPPVVSGAYPNHTFVAPETKSIVQYLSALGYTVAQSGKSHVSPGKVFSWKKIPGGKNPDFKKVDAFIKAQANEKKPFCLLLCSNEPHTPWNKGDRSRYPVDKIELPPYFVDTPETRDGFSRYLAEITYFDSQVGEAMDLVEKNGLTDDTLFIVTSEQGSSFAFAKWTCYDNGLQTALIARWPGKIKPDSENPAMIEYLDLLPTFIEAAGGTPPADFRGKSLLPVFAGKQSHKKFVHGIMTTRGINDGSSHYGIRSIRSKNYKLIWNLTPEIKFVNRCTTAPAFKSWLALAATGHAEAIAKTARYQQRPEFELYDIRKDPLEIVNLAGKPEWAEIQDSLHQGLQTWMKSCGDRGKATEMEALQHMTGSQTKRNKALKSSSKPKKR
ncbi:MAG: sulfatase [Akkermansiaceae bacterium]